jgi:hypothetical protein
MTTELKTVMDFCLEHAEDAPVARRISLYRGLAEFCGDAGRAAKLRRMADDLELADLRCREFRFTFTNGGGK